MFCVACGQALSSEKFCPKCGRQITPRAQEVVRAPEVAPAPVASSKSPLSLASKLLIIIGSSVAGLGLVVLLLVFVVLPALLPFSLSASSAQEKLLTVSDLGAGFAESGETSGLEDATGAIFFLTDETCDIEPDLKSQLEKATPLAYTEIDNGDTYSHFVEQVFEFSDQSDAARFIETARTGFDDVGCTSNSYTSDYMSWYSSIDETGTSQELIGAGGSASVAMTETSIIGTSSTASTYDGKKAMIARGKYVLYLSIFYDVDTTEWAATDVTNLLRQAIHREFG